MVVRGRSDSAFPATCGPTSVSSPRPSPLARWIWGLAVRLAGPPPQLEAARAELATLESRRAGAVAQLEKLREGIASSSELEACRLRGDVAELHRIAASRADKIRRLQARIAELETEVRRARDV